MASVIKHGTVGSFLTFSLSANWTDRKKRSTSDGKQMVKSPYQRSRQFLFITSKVFVQNSSGSWVIGTLSTVRMEFCFFPKMSRRNIEFCDAVCALCSCSYIYNGGRTHGGITFAKCVHYERKCQQENELNLTNFRETSIWGSVTLIYLIDVIPLLCRLS